MNYVFFLLCIYNSLKFIPDNAGPSRETVDLLWFSYLNPSGPLDSHWNIFPSLLQLMEKLTVLLKISLCLWVPITHIFILLFILLHFSSTKKKRCLLGVSIGLIPKETDLWISYILLCCQIEHLDWWKKGKKILVKCFHFSVITRQEVLPFLNRMSFFSEFQALLLLIAWNGYTCLGGRGVGVISIFFSQIYWISCLNNSYLRLAYFYFALCIIQGSHAPLKTWKSAWKMKKYSKVLK